MEGHFLWPKLLVKKIIKTWQFLLIFITISLLAVTSYLAYQNSLLKQQINNYQTQTTPETLFVDSTLKNQAKNYFREIFGNFSEYEYYKSLNVAPHECFEESELPDENKFDEAKAHLNSLGRKITFLCTTKTSNRMLVQSTNKDTDINEKDSFPYRLDIYTHFPKDERDIPSPQVQPVHQYSNSSDKEVFRFNQWFIRDESKQDLISYTIFNISNRQFWTYIYDPEDSWMEETGEYPFYVEYCELRNGKINICHTANKDDSNFWTIEETREIFNSQIFQ